MACVWEVCKSEVICILGDNLGLRYSLTILKTKQKDKKCIDTEFNNSQLELKLNIFVFGLLAGQNKQFEEVT